MANKGEPHTNGSQFYITLSANMHWMDKEYDSLLYSLSYPFFFVLLFLVFLLSLFFYFLYISFPSLSFVYLSFFDGN